MPNRVRIVAVRENERTELQRRARSKAEPARVVQRARIVLLAEQGLTGPQIAERVGCSEPTVVFWRDRYAQSGLVGLDHAPRPGGPVRVMTPEVAAEVLAATVRIAGPQRQPGLPQRRVCSTSDPASSASTSPSRAANRRRRVNSARVDKLDRSFLFSLITQEHVVIRHDNQRP